MSHPSNVAEKAPVQPDEVSPVPVRFEAALQPPKQVVKPPVIKPVEVSQPTSNSVPFPILGTRKYDGQKPSAREIIKVNFSFTDEELPEGDGDPFVEKLNSYEYASDAVAEGDVMIPTVVGVPVEKQAYADASGQYWRPLDGVEIDLADGDYIRRTTIVMPDPQEQEIVYHFSVKQGKILGCTWDGHFVAQATYAQDDPLPLGFDEVESNYNKLPYTQDLYSMLKDTNFSFNFDQYEAYSIKYLQLNLVDCENWLNAGGSLLAYFISDPAQTTSYNMGTFSNKAVVHYPHLHTVKIFRHGTSFSAKIPVDSGIFFTKVGGPTRLYSPGILGIVPLPGISVNKFKIAAILDAVVDFYAPTLITADLDTRRWVNHKLTQPGTVLLNQSLPESNIYFDVPEQLEDGKYQPTAPVNFKIVYKGITYFDNASFLKVTDGLLRYKLAHLHEHTTDFTQDQSEVTIVTAPETFISWI